MKASASMECGAYSVPEVRNACHGQGRRRGQRTRRLRTVLGGSIPSQHDAACARERSRALPPKEHCPVSGSRGGASPPSARGTPARKRTLRRWTRAPWRWGRAAALPELPSRCRARRACADAYDRVHEPLAIEEGRSSGGENCAVLTQKTRDACSSQWGCSPHESFPSVQKNLACSAEEESSTTVHREHMTPTVREDVDCFETNCESESCKGHSACVCGLLRRDAVRGLWREEDGHRRRRRELRLPPLRFLRGEGRIRRDALREGRGMRRRERACTVTRFPRQGSRHRGR